MEQMCPLTKDLCLQKQCAWHLPADLRNRLKFHDQQIECSIPLLVFQNSELLKTISSLAVSLRYRR